MTFLADLTTYSTVYCNSSIIVYVYDGGQFLFLKPAGLPLEGKQSMNQSLAMTSFI